MAEIIKARYYFICENFSRDFYSTKDGEICFSFPCYNTGSLLEETTETARSNYNNCISNPDKYRDAGIVEHHFNKIESAILHCDCGNEFELVDEYLGGCCCPKCGRWYSVLSGQRLNQPKTWSKGEDW